MAKDRLAKHGSPVSNYGSISPPGPRPSRSQSILALDVSKSESSYHDDYIEFTLGEPHAGTDTSAPLEHFNPFREDIRGNLRMRREQKQHLKRAALCTYEEIPERIRDNKYLRYGYRRIGTSYCGCVGSAFYQNNQTLNIWTSLSAIFMHIYLAVDVFVFKGWLTGIDMQREGVKHVDKVFFAWWFFCNVLMNVASTMAHMFSCHQESHFWKWFQFDVSSFCCITFVHIYGTELYNWYLPNEWLLPYLILAYGVSIYFFLALIYWNFFNPKVPKWQKVIVACLVAIFSGVPVIHRMFFVRWEWAWAITFCTLLMGGVVFAGFLPERWAPPGSLDFEFYSHPLWHLLYVAAFLVMTIAYFEDYLNTRHMVPRGAIRDQYPIWVMLMIPAFALLPFWRSVIVAWWRNYEYKAHQRELRRRAETGYTDGWHRMSEMEPGNDTIVKKELAQPQTTSKDLQIDPANSQ